MTLRDPASESNPDMDDRDDSVAQGEIDRDRELIQETLDFWQPRSFRKLTEADAREIIVNSRAFMRFLREWAAAERTAAHPGPSDDDEERGHTA